MILLTKNGIVGALTLEPYERLRSNGRGYWTQVLTLTDSHGRWLTNMHWRSNAPKKAVKQLTQLGWTLV